MNEPDERYSTSEDAIIGAFFLLAKEKALDKISVSDVIKKAGIVRSTFYNHYENIPALILAAEDKTLDDIFKMMESFHPKNDHEICSSYFLAICNYTRENPFLTNLIKSARGDGFFEKAMTMFHRYVSNVTDTISTAETAKDEHAYMIAGTIGTTLGVLHKWIAEDFKSTPEYVSETLTKIFMNGAIQFLI